jgi:hypothetical protein
MSTEFIEPPIQVAATSFGVDVSSLGGINTALTSPSTAGKLLIVSDAQTLSGDAEVLSSQTLMVIQSGSIALAGHTLTVNGHISAPPRQIFTGSGTVTYGANSVLYWQQWTGSGTLLVFNPAVAGAPFSLAANAHDQVVAGLTAESLSIANQVQGDILYHNGSIWTRLGAGTSGQILTTQGAGANPVWADLALPSPPQPTDVTSVSPDMTLAIGEKAYVTASGATSIPLNIATEDGQVYELTMTGTASVGVSSAFAALLPNNTPYSNCFHYMSLWGHATNHGSGVGFYDSLLLDIAGSSPSSVRATIWTSTAAKRVQSQVDELCLTSSYWTGLVSTRWTQESSEYDDTTTPWTSLGTISLPYAWTGTITIERKF